MNISKIVNSYENRSAIVVAVVYEYKNRIIIETKMYITALKQNSVGDHFIGNIAEKRERCKIFTFHNMGSMKIVQISNNRHEALKMNLRNEFKIRITKNLLVAHNCCVLKFTMQRYCEINYKSK